MRGPPVSCNSNSQDTQLKKDISSEQNSELRTYRYPASTRVLFDKRAILLPPQMYGSIIPLDSLGMQGEMSWQIVHRRGPSSWPKNTEMSNKIGNSNGDTPGKALPACIVDIVTVPPTLTAAFQEPETCFLCCGTAPVSAAQQPSALELLQGGSLSAVGL